MYDLTLRPGPSLVFGFPETRENKRTRGTANVTAQASQFLFHAVRIEPGVTLNDLLLLLDACPALVDIFRRRFAEQVGEEVAKGPLAQTSDRGQSPQALDYLELRWNWALDTDTHMYSSVHDLELSGVGPALSEDDAQRRLKAGDRERWSLKLTPVRELLRLRVVFCPDFEIAEADLNARRYGEPVAKGHLNAVTLGQVLQSVLSELTFHGGPAEQSQLAEELSKQLANLSAGDDGLADAEELLDELLPEGPAFDAMFETLGATPFTEVRQAMHDMEDDEDASVSFAARFGGRVRVRGEHTGLTARQFRKAFRAALLNASSR